MLLQGDLELAGKVSEAYRKDSRLVVKWLERQEKRLIYCIQDIPRFIAFLAHLRSDLWGVGKLIDDAISRLAQYFQRYAQIVNMKFRWGRNAEVQDQARGRKVAP